MRRQRVKRDFARASCDLARPRRARQGGRVIEAVVFDLDGVLVDSEPVWEQVRRQVVAAHGGHWAPGAQQRLMGMSTGEWAGYLSHDLGTGLPPEEVAGQVIGQMAARYSDQVPFLPGAVAAGAGEFLPARADRHGP